MTALRSAIAMPDSWKEELAKDHLIKSDSYILDSLHPACSMEMDMIFCTVMMSTLVEKMKYFIRLSHLSIPLSIGISIN